MNTRQPLRELQDTLDSLDNISRSASEEFKQAFDEWSLYYLQRALQENLAGRILKRRTGHLASKTGITRARVQGRDLKVEVFTTGVPYAAIHEHGGVISPTRGRMLAIPLRAVLTPAGVARKSPREYMNTFIARSRAGNLIIFQKIARDSIIPLFVLKESVTIPARHWASDAVNRTIQDLVDILRRRFGHLWIQ